MEPSIFQKKPVVLDLEPGKYFWCQCGLSQAQPWCDGSHSGTSLNPIAFTITEKKKAAVCLCKHTQNMPFCDGTHSKLP